MRGEYPLKLPRLKGLMELKKKKKKKEEEFCVDFSKCASGNCAFHNVINVTERKKEKNKKKFRYFFRIKRSVITYFRVWTCAREARAGKLYKFGTRWLHNN